jgi:hypothetical protein
MDQMTTAPWLAGTKQKSKRPLKPLAAATLIESCVAKGMGLGSEELAVIYDPDRSDRRGFWRYFDSDPSAAAVVEATLAAVA